VAIAIGATVVSVHKAGGWVERKHGKKRYVKLSFAVDVEDKMVVGMEGSTDDAHNSRHLSVWWRRQRSTEQSLRG